MEKSSELIEINVYKNLLLSRDIQFFLGVRLIGIGVHFHDKNAIKKVQQKKLFQCHLYNDN